MSRLHSDAYNEHLLYAQRLDQSSSSPPSSSLGAGGGGGGGGDENPQEALPNTALSSPNNNNNNTKQYSTSPSTSAIKEETFMKQYLSLIVTAVLALSLIGLVFGIIPYYAVHAAHKYKYNETLYWTAGAFVLIAVPVSVHGIIQHLVNYYMPQVQKYVIRILFMVPIFSIQAWFSLFFHSASAYIAAFRELYEAFVLSSFVYYIIELLGGEQTLSQKLVTKPPSHGHHGPIFGHIFRPWTMGRPFMINCKYGVLQYVLVKIIT
eukprot:CAMPEP_0201653626 /NCGR_PEP_ID=MMETSP0493-20130528/45082_1 /ASSEMBLY_ACC=CAM_ASM_000838 /TAXON_ID=420259 /ORGANISM="Thalassiosira gravida, Strain GMp14c1" /LENGTH=263 /DNA_ID=CAMNT_0048130163 /DNA_START=55 /DNA_END=842 /DNA_ORIENTATION=-